MSQFYKFERNITLLLITIIFGLVITFLQYNLIKNELTNTLELENNHMHKAFDNTFNRLKEELTFNSNKLISIPGLKKSFLEQDRHKVYELVKEYYTDITSLNKHLKILTFRLIDGSTFLRVHKPEMYGDKLNKKRKIILDTIHTQKRQYGFEVGKLKMTYRVVSPIVYNNKLIGVVEIGVEPEYITDTLDNIFNTKMALLVKKEDLSINISNESSKSIENYAFARGDKLFESQLNHINLKEQYSKINYKEEDYYINSSFNLFNNKKEIASKILIAFSLKNYNQKLSNLIQINLIITILLFLALLIGFNYFTRRIKKSHDTIRTQDEILFTQSKMAAMGEMIENIAHQWRQPLSVISTAASGIQTKKEFDMLTDKELNEFVNSINDSSQHLSQTIDDFRNFYKQDKQIQEFNILQSIEKSIRLTSSTLKNGNITIQNSVDNCVVSGFENEVIQVLINILNNAKDALDNIEQKDKIIQIDSTLVGEKISITFQDNAGGIPPETLPKVFDHKFTTKTEQNGTGIGLYMSKIIMKKSNGSIAVQNKTFNYKKQNFKGACFTIELTIVQTDESI